MEIPPANFRTKNLSSLFAMALSSVKLHTHGLKHSNSLFFSNDSAIAMIFTNTGCEMIETLECKCTGVCDNFILLVSFIKNAVCTTVVATSALMGLPSQFSDNLSHP